MFSFFFKTQTTVNPIHKFRDYILDTTNKSIQKKIETYKTTPYYEFIEIEKEKENNNNNNVYFILFLSIYSILHSIIKKKCFLE